MLVESETLTVSIMDKNFHVICKEDEAEELYAAAEFLDKKMREIRDGGRIIGMDKIAVIAALNISHELLSKYQKQSDNKKQLDKTLGLLQDKIEQALKRNDIFK